MQVTFVINYDAERLFGDMRFFSFVGSPFFVRRLARTTYLVCNEKNLFEVPLYRTSKTLYV